MKNSSIGKEVEEFHNSIIELIKKYQFRDRNEITSFGISVSQCYVLETLHFQGALTMKKLAEQMHLTISTITRVVDQLEGKKLVQRKQHIEDSRIRMIRLTSRGEKVFLKSWANVFESEKRIFENIKPEHRKVLLSLLKDLNNSVDQWQGTCKIME
ncbi:MAG: MarR family transcriptional regulator [Ignavibacteria bacterium]|nr:MarR family transcriptional regulator [Ignavibacteria bacterium]